MEMVSAEKAKKQKGKKKPQNNYCTNRIKRARERETEQLQSH
jgi:hypothetical protein